MLFDLQNKMSQMQSDYEQHLAEEESIRRLQSVELKLPPDEISGACDDLLQKQYDLQRDFMALEELVAQETNLSRDEIASAERERDAVMKKASEQLQSVVEKRLLLQHLQQMQIQTIDPTLLSESRAKLVQLEEAVGKVQMQIDDENARAANERV